jgi:hypothetical protein
VRPSNAGTVVNQFSDIKFPELAMKFTQIESPAVSSPEYYLTPAPNDDAIRKLLLVDRHLIILNNSGYTSDE